MPPLTMSVLLLHGSKKTEAPSAFDVHSWEQTPLVMRWGAMPFSLRSEPFLPECSVCPSTGAQSGSWRTFSQMKLFEYCQSIARHGHLCTHVRAHTQLNMHTCQPVCAHYLVQKWERRNKVEEKDRRTNSEERHR